MRPFADADLRSIYAAVGSAQVSGAFGGPHGPLEATAWLHLSIGDLERLDDALAALTLGDENALPILRTLGAHEQPIVPFTTSDTLDDDELDRAEIGITDPVALAVAVHLLASRGDEEAAKQLLWFAVRRTAAVNLALGVAQRYSVGWFSTRYFDTRMRTISPLATGDEAPHGHGSDGHGDDDHHHDDEASSSGVGHAHHEGCECLDHEPLTEALYRRWSHLVELVAEEAETTTFPAADERSLYERALDRADARAGHRPQEPSTASPIVAHLLRDDDRDTAVAAGPLTLTPVSRLVVAGEPIHLWVRLEGIDSPTAVAVQAAGADPVTVTVRPGEWESLVTLKPVRQPGRLEVKASVAGAAVTALPLLLDVVADRPPCLPHEGGAWQIARVDARETPEKCKPAQTASGAASKLIGHAGKHLTGAYNSAVVGSQLCVKKANTKRCLKKRKETVQKCTGERDEGYDRCAAEEDRGYNRCCDWAPCSWFCKAWVWVSHIVCVAWEWISNIVCVAWAWITNVVCVLWEVIKAAACVIGSIALGVVKAVVGLVLLGTGILVNMIATFIGFLCVLLGARPKEEASDTLKVVAVHMALLHTGKVLLMGYDEGVYPVDADHPADFTAVADSDRGLCAIWDPATGKARYTKDLRRNLFCAHHAFLPDGRLLVASGQFPLPGLPKSLIPFRLLAPGADADLHTFDPASETWQRLPDMEKGRWYPTCVRLPDGRIFISSGTNGYATSPGLGRGIQNTWEYADGTGPAGGKNGTGFFWFHLYPFHHVLTNGELFTHADRATRLFDPATSGWRRVAPSAAALNAGPGITVWPYSRTGPGPGTSVLLPLHPTRDGDRWTYPTGRVLILGGGGAEGEPEPNITNEAHDLHANTPATRNAEIIDFDESTPNWRATTPMANGRVMPDSVLLPDGKVLVIGGGRYGKSGGLLAHFASVDMAGEPDKGALDPILEPELFDPAAETWRALCRKPIGRLYHTTAMLLPDARVLVAGHDGALNMPPYDRSRYELELFTPPYLFAPDGSPARRPVISRAPGDIHYGQQLDVEVSEHVASAALVAPSALTHQINPSQRYVGLGIEGQDPGGALRLAGPPDANVAPPGWYLLFVVDDAGTPSIGSWIHVTAG
jgi:Galactose oxidase-like, Early set domain